MSPINAVVDTGQHRLSDFSGGGVGSVGDGQDLKRTTTSLSIVSEENMEEPGWSCEKRKGGWGV